MLRNSDAVHGGFAAIIGSIYERGVEEAVPWLIAMVCVALGCWASAYDGQLVLGERSPN